MRGSAWLAACLLLVAFSLHGADDRFVAADSALVGEPVKGDLIAAGGELRLRSPVDGDVIAAGGLLRIETAGGQDLYAAGGQVTFDGSLARNARIAGGSVSVGPQARIDGNASLAGGRVEMRGAIGGYLQAAAGRVLIDGRVQGDVDASAGELELGSRARIGGKLRYRGGAPVRMDPAAQVLGGVERLEMPASAGRARSAAPAAFGVWTLGLMLLAAVLVWASPALTARVAQVARRRLAWSLLAGFLALVAVPAATVVLAVTLIGLPLAAIVLLAYLALLLLGYVASGIALGDAVLSRWRSSGAGSGWRTGAAALGVVLLGVLTLVPWLGALVAFLTLIAGMGALVLGARAASSVA